MSDVSALPPPALPKNPTGSRNAASAFWKLMYQVAVVAGATHVLFVCLFYSLGATTLAWINVCSVLLFSATYVCLRLRRNLMASCLIVGEILFHASLATRAIGWDSGFHYYMLLVAPVVVISTIERRHLKTILNIGVLLAYVSMDAFMRDLPPYDTLAPQALAVLRGVNIAITVGLMTYLSALHMKLVRQAEKKLRVLATTDPLTQLLNRRSLLELADEALRNTPQAAPASLAFVLADVDHFKSINDQHGHAAGDAVLTAVSDVLRQAVRGQDKVARWGGEEFLVMMPGATLETARAVAERLREQVAAIHVPFEGKHIRVSMTFGVSVYHGNGESLDAPINRADVALYAGKQAGRNQVAVEQGIGSPVTA